jgi:acetoin utilization deacetylase AcuC-like enzyme
VNNVAVAAAHAIEVLQLRTAVVDFDVHHGNGTEQWARSQGAFFGSVHLLEVDDENHDLDFFPGSGASCDTALIVNCGIKPAWREGNNSRARFVDAVEKRIAPRLKEFRPDLLIISAGFDGARGARLSKKHLTAPYRRHGTGDAWGRRVADRGRPGSRA